MLTSEYPKPHPVLSENASTQPRVIAPVQQRRENIFKGRVASIDLRIGLNLLGEEGRKLLAEYILHKRQQ